MAAKRMLLGPFKSVSMEGELISLQVDPDYLDKVSESGVPFELKIHPRMVKRAYKAPPSTRSGERYWILVEFERGYDLYKHYRLANRAKYARRIPRLVAKVCPSCGACLIDGLCPSCGDEVEKPRYLEVWRDPHVREELFGPVKSAEKTASELVFRSSSGEFRVRREVLHESIVSIVKAGDGAYVKYLRIPKVDEEKNMAEG